MGRKITGKLGREAALKHTADEGTTSKTTKKMYTMTFLSFLWWIDCVATLSSEQ